MGNLGWKKTMKVCCIKITSGMWSAISIINGWIWVKLWTKQTKLNLIINAKTVKSVCLCILVLYKYSWNIGYQYIINTPYLIYQDADNNVGLRLHLVQSHWVWSSSAQIWGSTTNHARCTTLSHHQSQHCMGLCGTIRLNWQSDI